jgi:hypothetical protein
LIDAMVHAPPGSAWLHLNLPPAIARHSEYNRLS